MKVEKGTELFIPVAVVGFSASGDTVQMKTKDGKLMLFCDRNELNTLCVDKGCNVKEQKSEDRNARFDEYLKLKRDTRLFSKNIGYVFFLNSISEDGAVLTPLHSSQEPLAGIKENLEDLVNNYIVLKFEDNDIITDGINFFTVVHAFADCYFVRSCTTTHNITKVQYELLQSRFNVFKVPELGSVLVDRETKKGFKVSRFDFKSVSLGSFRHEVQIPTSSLYEHFYTPKFKAGDCIEHYSTEFLSVVIQVNVDGYIIQGVNLERAIIDFKSEEQYVLKTLS